MPELRGLSLDSGRGSAGERTFHAQDPVGGQPLEPGYHPASPLQAVGFTGSRAGGEALARPNPRGLWRLVDGVRSNAPVQVAT